MNMVMIIVYAIWMGIDADWNSALLITEPWNMAGWDIPERSPNEMTFSYIYNLYIYVSWCIHIYMCVCVLIGESWNTLEGFPLPCLSTRGYKATIDGKTQQRGKQILNSEAFASSIYTAEQRMWVGSIFQNWVTLSGKTLGSPTLYSFAKGYSIDKL